MELELMGKWLLVELEELVWLELKQLMEEFLEQVLVQWVVEEQIQ